MDVKSDGQVSDGGNLDNTAKEGGLGWVQFGGSVELIGHVQQALDLQVYNSRRSSGLETFCESSIHSLSERSLKKTSCYFKSKEDLLSHDKELKFFL